MSKPLPTVPLKDDARFLEFCEFLRQAPIRPAARLVHCSYEDHLSVLEVPVVPQPNCEISYCWFNCLDLQHLHGGEVVYGWSLWLDRDAYVAQHHAVFRSEKGELLDLTPNEGFAEKALFMPDGRAPFDILELRAPSSLYWWASSKYEWFFGHVRSQSFFIGRMDPKADQEARVDRTRQRYLHLA